MVKLQVDFEHSDRTWWEAGGQDLWDAICDDGNSIIVDDAIASSWVSEASQIEGWEGGHEFAPHPIVSIEITDEEAELE